MQRELRSGKLVHSPPLCARSRRGPVGGFALSEADDDASLSLDDDMFLRRRGTRACHKWESTALAAAVCELCRCPVLRVLVSSHPLCSSRDKLCPCVLFAFGRHSSRSSVQFCVAQPRLPDQSR